MFRQIVLGLTATAALSAAVLVPTAASAYPIPQPHRLSGPPGGVAVWVCGHAWHDGRPFNCHWVIRGGHFGSAGR